MANDHYYKKITFIHSSRFVYIAVSDLHEILTGPDIQATVGSWDYSENSWFLLTIIIGTCNIDY